MDKAYIEQAAKDYAKEVWGDFSEVVLKDYGVEFSLGNIAQTDFEAGVKWLLSVQEEIKATETK